MRNLTDTELTHISAGTTLSDEDRLWGIMGVLAGAVVGNCFSTEGNQHIPTLVGAAIGGLIDLFGSVYGSTTKL